MFEVVTSLLDKARDLVDDDPARAIDYLTAAKRILDDKLEEGE